MRTEEPDQPVILLAEDDAVFRELIASALRRDGYRVIEAKDGEHLRTLARQLLYSGHEPRPELIITDIRMPGGTGLEVLRALRELDRHTPVILMTGFGAPEVTESAEQLGATALFSKPFDLSELRQRVSAILPIV